MTQKTSPSHNYLGSILFAFGILLGTLLFSGLIWSDIEAVFYGLPQLTRDTLPGFSCPPLMTRSETANLQATIRNETDLPIKPVVRFEISTPGVLQSERIQIALEPGESQTLEMPVSEKNIDLKFFIFAKAYRYPAYKTSMAEATCGILVLDIPFVNGTLLLVVWLGASIICTLAGLWKLESRTVFSGKATSLSTARQVLTVVMLIGLLLGVQGAWLPGLMAAVLMILMVTILFYFSLTH